jgi:hypothetical protein
MRKGHPLVIVSAAQRAASSPLLPNLLATIMLLPVSLPCKMRGPIFRPRKSSTGTRSQCFEVVRSMSSLCSSQCYQDYPDSLRENVTTGVYREERSGEQQGRLSLQQRGERRGYSPLPSATLVCIYPSGGLFALLYACLTTLLEGAGDHIGHRVPVWRTLREAAALALLVDEEDRAAR